MTKLFSRTFHHYEIGLKEIVLTVGDDTVSVVDPRDYRVIEEISLDSAKAIKEFLIEQEQQDGKS